MGHQELEEWIKNSDLSEEMKQKMLKDLENIKSIYQRNFLIFCIML